MTNQDETPMGATRGPSPQLCPECDERKNKIIDTPLICEGCRRTIARTVLGESLSSSHENITTNPLSPPHEILTPPSSDIPLRDQLAKILFEPRPHANPYKICASDPTTPSSYSDTPSLTPSSISLASLDFLPRGPPQEPLSPRLETAPIYINIAIPAANTRSMVASSTSSSSSLSPSSSSSSSSAPSYFQIQRPLAEIYQPPRRRYLLRACLDICGCNDGAEREEEE